MALRLIQKVSVLLGRAVRRPRRREIEEAQSITTSFMHLSLPDMPLCLALPTPTPPTPASISLLV